MYQTRALMITCFSTHNIQAYVAGQPVYGGVNDPRLGDLHDKSDPGYFGHIELARPVYHQGFIDVILKSLRCVCFHCSRIKMEDTEYKFQMAKKLKNRKRRLDAMWVLFLDRRGDAVGFCLGCSWFFAVIVISGMHWFVQRRNVIIAMAISQNTPGWGCMWRLSMLTKWSVFQEGVGIRNNSWVLKRLWTSCK